MPPVAQARDIDGPDQGPRAARLQRVERRDIARQLIDATSNGRGPSIVLGGGRKEFLTKAQADPQRPGQHGLRSDGRDLIAEWRQAHPQGAYVTTAAELAAAAGTLEELRAAMAEFEGSPLRETATNLVFADGVPGSGLMFIGEAPGGDEDRLGRPFVGVSGQLLDRMLESVGIDSERDAYICNVIKCRPPDNRRPTPAEIAACRPFLLRQIALVNPRVILLVGATALEGVLAIKGGITRLRGQWRSGEGEVLEGRLLMPILHPSYLLRNPSREQGSPKWHTWQDLKEVRRRLEEGSGPTPASPARAHSSQDTIISAAPPPGSNVQQPSLPLDLDL